MNGGYARVYEQVVQFLYHEAELLDGGRFSEWLDLLTDDISYRMPVRINREKGDHPDTSDVMEHFSEDRTTLRLRVERLKTDFAWAEDPPSRTRRFVSNVRVAPGAVDGEIEVRSYVLLYRNRGDTPAVELISGERRDVLLRAGDGWKLRKRTIIVDQASLGAKNLAIFL
jgi:3-phenylpropionate/cinnamic acid dioxygenase small subunit